MIGSLTSDPRARNWPFGAALYDPLSMVMIILTIYARQQSQAAGGG